MIEISHRQAQRMIREAVDRRLPDEQWSNLQLHLEGCAECRAYRDRISATEKGLRRALRSRWNAARGPAEDVGALMVARRARRDRRIKFIKRSWIYVLGGLLLIGWMIYRQLPENRAPAPAAAPRATIDLAAPTPTPKRTFSGLAVFQSRRDGNDEIYLMNASPAGIDLTNLTNNPAADWSPAWSPDGQWIAFLSDRSGRAELYVLHISGSRLVQLTNDARIQWEGPPSWSYDGRQIGLAGLRQGAPGSAEKPSRWLYIVPLDGSPPRSIAGTRDAPGTLRFSPVAPAVAFAGSPKAPGLFIINYVTGSSMKVVNDDYRQSGMPFLQNGAFDWSLGGANLVYIQDAPQDGIAGAEETQSLVRLSTEIYARPSTGSVNEPSVVIDSLPKAGSFRAATWVSNSLLVATLHNGGDKNCWTVRLSHYANRNLSPRDLLGLCIDGGLEHSQWSADGSWVLVVGHTPAEPQPDIYALHVPSTLKRKDTSSLSPEFGEAAVFERLGVLGNEPRDPVSHFASWVAPQMRSAEIALEIKPIAADATQVDAVQAQTITQLPAQMPGWLVTAEEGADRRSVLYRARADGSGRELLDPHGACPRISPDGKRLAFISDEGNAYRGINDVYVMDMASKAVTRLTDHVIQAEYLGGSEDDPLPRYGCPVWSPDGKLLAVMLRTLYRDFLALLPVDGAQSQGRFVELDRMSGEPMWHARNFADPAQGADLVLLALPADGADPARVVAVDVAAVLAATYRFPQAILYDRIDFLGWDWVDAMAYSPDGSRMAFVVAHGNETVPAQSSAQLRVMNSADLSLVSSRALQNYHPLNGGVKLMTWLNDTSLAFVESTSMIGPVKTVIERYTLPVGSRAPLTFVTIASLEDWAYAAAWREGRYVVVSTESGLWALDIYGQSAEGAANLPSVPAEVVGPVYVGDADAREVDWK